MGCCTNKRVLLFLLIGVAVFFGLAYVLQWKAVLGYVPFLLFLLCPLMHVFMMAGHGDHGKRRGQPAKDKERGSCH